MDKKTVLLTGGTGFLGKFVKNILEKTHNVYVLSRSGDTNLTGDLSQLDAGINLEAIKHIKFDIMVHLAGLYDFNSSKADYYQHNVAGMSIALNLADKLEIPYFVNASTVAVAINSRFKRVTPYDLNSNAHFPDHYAESKAFGEQILKNWNSPTLKGKINLRLGVLVGDSKHGHIEKIDGIYHAAEALNKISSIIEKSPGFIFLPGDESIHLPILPVDICAKAIATFVDWTFASEPVGFKSFNITPDERIDVRMVYQWALKGLKVSQKNVVIVSEIPKKVLKKISKLIAKLPECEVHYLLNFPIYDSADTKAVLGASWCPEFSTYEHAIRRGYEKYVSYRRN